MNKLPIKRLLAIILIAYLSPISFGQLVSTITIGGPSYQGKDVQVDLPADQRIKNIGSKLDGAGMCVFSSVEMSGRWANLEQLRGFRNWCAEHYPGGGYPSKLDKLLKAYCAAKSISVPVMIQVEGAEDFAFLELALKTGRMPSITYSGRDPHYHGQSVSHMVCIVYLDKEVAAICDNNFVGDNELVWMTRAEFNSRHKEGGAWGVVFQNPGATPPPRN